MFLLILLFAGVVQASQSSKTIRLLEVLKNLKKRGMMPANKNIKMIKLLQVLQNLQEVTELKVIEKFIQETPMTRTDKTPQRAKSPKRVSRSDTTSSQPKWLSKEELQRLGLLPSESSTSADKIFAANEPYCTIVSTPLLTLQQADSIQWPVGDIWSRVKQGEGGNCGYHALKNVSIVIDELFNKNLNFTRLTEAKEYLKFMEKTAPIIDAKQYRRGKSLDWLDGGELEDLKKSLPPFQNDNIVIVEHVPGLEFSEHVLQAVKNFKEKSDAVLGFVWNSGLRENLESMGGVHWVGYVAVKKMHQGDCVITLYSMDSGGGQGRMYDKDVCNVLSLSLKQVDQKLSKHAQEHMQLDIDTLRNPLRKNPADLADVVNMIVINWKDYKLPRDIQQQALQWLENTWKIASVTEKKNIAKDAWHQIEKKLNLVDSTRLSKLARSA